MLFFLNIDCNYFDYKPWFFLPLLNCFTPPYFLKYKTEYHDLPKVVYWHGKLHFFAKNLRKAKEMEEVMKLHLLSLKLAGKNDIITLPKSELAYLGNWESEKFRQNK